MRIVMLVLACFAFTACVGFGVSGQVCLDPKPINLVGKAALDIEAALHAKCVGGGINADTGKMEIGISGGMSTPQTPAASPPVK